MSCEDYRQLLGAYLDDSLDEVRRTGFRAHLKSCRDCRVHAIAEEPTLAFSLMDDPEPSERRIEACVTGVMAGIRQERLERRLRPSRRPWLAAAAAVVIAVIAASVWWMNQPAEVPALQADAAEVVETAPETTEATPDATEPPPRVEVDMTHEEMRVYQYAIGDDAQTGAVFIVNPGMEL